MERDRIAMRLWNVVLLAALLPILQSSPIIAIMSFQFLVSSFLC